MTCTCMQRRSRNEKRCVNLLSSVTGRHGQSSLSYRTHRKRCFPCSTRRDATFLANLCQIRSGCIGTIPFSFFIDAFLFTGSIVIRFDACSRMSDSTASIRYVLFYGYERGRRRLFFIKSRSKRVFRYRGSSRRTIG